MNTHFVDDVGRDSDLRACCPEPRRDIPDAPGRRTRQLADLDLEHGRDHEDRSVVLKLGRDPQHPAEYRASESRHQRFDVAHAIQERNDGR
jgi:hypothetical protein